MTDDYNKKIGVQKEVLEALPRNNAKNNKLYKENRGKGGGMVKLKFKRIRIMR